MKLVEGDLEFFFSGAISAVKFDDETVHGSSSIQPVDFVVEFDEVFRFVEVKDPDVPNAENVAEFKEKLKSGKLTRQLAGKYRDSLFFRGFQSNSQKSVEYVVLLSMKVLEDALLIAKQDELQRSIPFSHATWEGTSASVCAILNIDQWKKRYGEESIRRLSELR